MAGGKLAMHSKEILVTIVPIVIMLLICAVHIVYGITRASVNWVKTGKKPLPFRIPTRNECIGIAFYVIFYAVVLLWLFSQFVMLIK